MSCSTLPVVVLKSFEIKTFIMGYHAYKSILTPAKDKGLNAAMQTINALDKYAVTIKRKESQVVGHLLLGKSGKFAKTLFYFLKASQNDDCIAVVCETPVNQSDRISMRVPCK